LWLSSSVRSHRIERNMTQETCPIACALRFAQDGKDLDHASATHVSVQVEIDFDGNLDPYRMTIFHRRLELPGLYRFDGLFI
jgi:hypothetical protein